MHHNVTDQTTHLVSLGTRRTLNILRALVRGLWIIDFRWVLDSIKAKRWLPEENYELVSFSKAVKVCSILFLSNIQIILQKTFICSVYFLILIIFLFLFWFFLKICRVEQQAFGKFYKCELFTNLGGFYVSAHCAPIPRLQVRELIKICGGRVMGTRDRARYIVGGPATHVELQLIISPLWILDSITVMELMKFNDYIIKTPIPTESASKLSSQETKKR